MATRVAVQADQLYYRYNGGIDALNGIDLTILESKKVGIIGPNGAGKSTFLSLLNGLRLPQGTLEIFGTPLTKRTQKDIRAIVGLVFQNPDDQLFMPTVFDDVAFGPRSKNCTPDEVIALVNESLENVDIKHLADRSTLQLSHGEKKLTAIAGILALQPQLVAIDEPTGNLDALHRRKLIQWILASRQTLIITSHDLDLLYDTCSRIIIFNQGKIVADDKTENILHNKKLLEDNQLELPLKLQSHKPVTGDY